MSDNCYCDYDPATVYRANLVKARKSHKCEECGRKIGVGERYEYVFAVWCGDAHSMRTCSHCLDVRAFVKNSIPCFCWMHGSMIDDAKEAMKEAYFRASEEMSGVLFSFGRLLVKQKNAQVTT